MATQEDFEREKREREEAEKRNPLLRMGLGDLLREKDRLFMAHHYIDFPEYTQIINEINRRYQELDERLNQIERKDVRY